jgi:hypothetical protein
VNSPTHRELDLWGCPRRGTRFGGGDAWGKSRPGREKIQGKVHEKEEKPLLRCINTLEYM